MWHQTKVSEIAGIQFPILQGPFGGNLSLLSVEMVSTVSIEGGLGGYGANTLCQQEIAEADQQILKTQKPYNVNLWVSDTDAVGDAVSDGQFRQARTLFKPHLDELMIGLPDKQAPFKSRSEDHVEAILKSVLEEPTKYFDHLKS